MLEAEEPFDAREYFVSGILPMEQLCNDLDFNKRQVNNISYYKTVGQWTVYVTPGSNQSVISVSINYASSLETVFHRYVNDEQGKRLLPEILAIAQEHTDPNGWVLRNSQALVKLSKLGS